MGVSTGVLPVDLNDVKWFPMSRLTPERIQVLIDAVMQTLEALHIYQNL